jgi:hypothetical protein
MLQMLLSNHGTPKGWTKCVLSFCRWASLMYA